MSVESLARVLGAEFWSAEVVSAESARRQASTRMAAGRPAVCWSEDGRHFVAWGVKGAGA